MHLKVKRPRVSTGHKHLDTKSKTSQKDHSFCQTNMSYICPFPWRHHRTWRHRTHRHINTQLLTAPVLLYHGYFVMLELQLNKNKMHETFPLIAGAGTLCHLITLCCIEVPQAKHKHGKESLQCFELHANASVLACSQSQCWHAGFAGIKPNVFSILLQHADICKQCPSEADGDVIHFQLYSHKP